MKRRNAVWTMICFLCLIVADFVEAKEKNFDRFTQKNIPAIVVATKKLTIPHYFRAFNPSLIKYHEGYLLTFRLLPDPLMLWISHIYIVKLDDAFEMISTPQLLNVRMSSESQVPLQSEDARIFSYKDDLYVAYNDNDEQINPSGKQRRDMFISQIKEEEGEFVVSKPIKLCYAKCFQTQHWQKNRVPFEYENALLFTYSQSPHEVIYADLNTGQCVEFEKTQPKIEWKFGELRGGTPASLVDGEYLSFYHSQVRTQSAVSKDKYRHHYYMGAYTFEAKPPFSITRYTPLPIIGENFYTESNREKRVVFPGGFVVSEPYIYVAFGKDDEEIWIAILDKEKLYSMMKSLPK